MQRGIDRQSKKYSLFTGFYIPQGIGQIINRKEPENPPQSSNPRLSGLLTQGFIKPWVFLWQEILSVPQGSASIQRL